MCHICVLVTDNITIMTGVALRVQSSPMGPYMSLMRQMSRKQKLDVVAYLIDTIQDDDSSAELQTKTQREVPESFKKLRGLVSFTEEEIAKDERLAYIMGR